MLQKLPGKSQQVGKGKQDNTEKSWILMLIAVYLIEL